MTNELVYNFLYNTDEFVKQFQRVLDRTPRERNANEVDFWIHFFCSIGVTVQNTKLNNYKIRINDIVFSIENISDTKTKILNLAFKLQQQDKIILRSISIGKDDKVPDNINNNALQEIAQQFWGQNAETTINLQNVDEQVLILNIKTSHIRILHDHNTERSGDSSEVKVATLQTHRTQVVKNANILLDNILDVIAIPEATHGDSKMTFEHNVEIFFNHLITLYNTNKLVRAEAAYNGFVYGTLILNYKNKYGIDAYVEQSAGKGFLDLYFLLRKDNNQHNIFNAVKIIIEFKGTGNINSVIDAKNQIDNRAYYRLFGRTQSKSVVIVAVDFGTNQKKVLVLVRQMAAPKQDFISMLINEIPVGLNENTIKTDLQHIYYSIRSEQPLDRVILGELLSSAVEKKNMFVIQELPDNQHVNIFEFKPQNQNSVILTIIERKNLNLLTYDRITLKDTYKRLTKNNIASKNTVTIEEEIRNAIIYVQRDLKINAGTRIDITINPTGAVFESTKSANSYCLDIKVSNLASNPLQTQQSYISHFIKKYDFNSYIDIDHLIPALQHLDLDRISSPTNPDNRNIPNESQALNELRKEFFKLKDFITTEAHFKSVLHGVFLHKQYNSANIQVIPELSAGHGRADLILVLPPGSVLALELGCGDKKHVPDKQQQLEKYIAHLKTITDSEQVNGVALIFNKNAAVKDTVLVGEGFVGEVEHSTGEDSPLHPALDNQPGPSGVQTRGQKRANFDDSIQVSIPLEHIYVSNDRSKMGSHTPQDLNNPQFDPSGVQTRGQKRANFDVSSQPILKKVCKDTGSIRPKRATDSCLFSWEDLDEISTRRAENIDELQIDHKKFLEYLKGSDDQAKNSQLLELIKIRQTENSDNTIGHYNHILDQVIKYGDYNNYYRNESIQDIANDLAKNGFPVINTNLKNKVINVAGQLQLIQGIHGTSVACQTEGAERDCILSGLGLSYSFLSQPIEDIIVKQGAKFGIKISKNIGKAIPKILGYNTKFALKILGARYGTAYLKGAAGGITGIWDIVDIGLSAQVLKNCTDRADSDNKCTDREIRDNITNIVFAGVSFISGIAFTIISVSGPINIVISLALMVINIIYSGISAIVEYEEKYDTTDDENFRIFWHHVASQARPEDVEYLVARKEYVNNIVKKAWQDLIDIPDGVAAYAGGLGKIRLQHFPKECRRVRKYIEVVQGGGYAFVDDCTSAYTQPHLESCTAVIDMRSNSNCRSNSNTAPRMTVPHNCRLSRVLPDYINGATMTCLPKASDAVYEKHGTSRSDSNVIYDCDNSFIIEHDLRKNQHNKSIIFDTLLIDSGKIVSGHTFSNSIFMLSKNTIDINTYSKRNEFIFFSDKFDGTINVYNTEGPLNIMNIFNTRELSGDVITFNIQQNLDIVFNRVQTLIRSANISINGNPINYKIITPSQINDHLIDIQYHARKNKEDHITCESRGTESTNYANIFINSGGGFNNQRQDLIKNCNKAIIWPYTKVEGNNGTYIFYIKTEGYEKQNSSSEINIIGTGNIIFLDIALLRDCEDITYSKARNDISLRIKLGGNIFYILDIKNYLDKGSTVSNFNLIDKYGSNIIPKIEQNTTIVSKFELYIEKDIDDSDTNDVSVVKRYYRKISDKKIHYILFGIVKYQDRYYHFGSDSKDVIVLNKHIQFVQGGDESDIYIVGNDMDMGTVIIDNSSRDKKLDILMVQSVNDVSLVSQDDNLNILITKTKDHLFTIDNIIVRNYFVANWYKNLLLVDKEEKIFIPLFNIKKELRLVPFYSCHLNNMFEIVDEVVLDCDLNQIEYYRNNENLILFNKIMDQPILTIETFFNNQRQLEIYHYRNKEEVVLLQNNALDYYILEYFSSDIYIEDLRLAFTQLLNDSVVLSATLDKTKSFRFEYPNKWKGDNFLCTIKSSIINLSVSAMIKFVSKPGDCNDKYLRFKHRDKDVILVQQCSNNTEANDVKVRISGPLNLFGKNGLHTMVPSRMVIDDYHPITEHIEAQAKRAKDYKEKIPELYDKIFKEYKIDFDSTFFEIQHNQIQLTNGAVVSVSSDQEKLGIIIFKKFISHLVTIEQDYTDLNIYDRPRNKHILINGWFFDRKYAISTVVFDLGLEAIRIHKWNEDTNMIIGNGTAERLLHKLRLAEEISISKSIYLRASLSGDELHTLQCVIIVNNLNVILESYEVLGFSSAEEQINFVKNCQFTESSLVELKTFMFKIESYLYYSNSSNLLMPPPSMVHNMLALDAWYKLALRGYNYQRASDIYNKMSGEFAFDKIIENINKIQNVLRNTSNEEVLQRNRRDVDDKFITSGANSISSPVNELFNWFKNQYYCILDQIKELHTRTHTSKTTVSFVGGEQELRFKYAAKPYNINDELANSDTYNLARSSKSILEPSFAFNNRLWSWVWNKLSNLSFKLLPEADTANTYKSKSFNDIYKKIKQFNNHPSDTQSEESNNITSQYDYEMPNSKYTNSIPFSADDQTLHCVPYNWDSNNLVYVTDAMTCISPGGQVKVFSNVHQETNFIQTKVYSIHGDVYTNCRPVEFYGHDSVYCEGKHTNIIYTPVFQSKIFDHLDAQIMLFRVGVHSVTKLWDCMKIKPKQEYIERHIKIDKETIDLWTKSIEQVEILLSDLQDLESLNKEDLKFINNTHDDLCEIRQNIKNYIEKKIITTKEYEIINEKLEALIEELDETENKYFFDVHENCNQEISIEQLLHTSNGVQHNTVYYHNNSQQYYNNSYSLHDERLVLTGLEVMNQNFEGV